MLKKNSNWRVLPYQFYLLNYNDLVSQALSFYIMIKLKIKIERKYDRSIDIKIIKNLWTLNPLAYFSSNPGNQIISVFERKTDPKTKRNKANHSFFFKIFIITISYCISQQKKFHLKFIFLLYNCKFLQAR